MGIKRVALVTILIPIAIVIIVAPLLQGLLIFAQNSENEFSLNFYVTKASAAPVWARGYRIYGQSVGMIVGNNGITLLGNELSIFDAPMNPFTMKIDYDGNLLWSKIYPGEENYSYSFSTVIPLSNGYYIAAGNMIKNETENVGVCIIKFDENGNPAWGKGYYTEENASLNFITRLENGGYIGGGLLENKSNTGWLFSIDAQGNLLWSKHYSMGRSTSFKSALPIQNGFLVAGEVRNGYGTSLFLARLNYSGDVMWCRKYVDIINDTKIILKSMQDQIWVFATVPENKGDIIFLKLNGDGRVVESRRYGTSEEEQIGDAAVINDAAVILGSSLREERASLGNVTYVHNVSNLLLFKIDGGGKIQWQRLYYLGESFYGVAISKANNGYYFAANGKDFLPEFGRWHVPAIFKVNKYGGIGFPRNSSMKMREINLENSDIDVSMKEGSYSSGLQMLKVRNISLKAKSANISDVYLSDGYSPPLQPTNLSASIKEGKIYLSWKGPVDNGGVNITFYRIYRSEDGKDFVKIAETKNTTYVDTVEKGKKYEYYVTAVNDIGESEKSDIVGVCIPVEEIIPWGYVAIAAGIVGIVAIFLLLKKMKNNRR